MSSALISRGPLDGFDWPQSEAFAMQLAPAGACFILRGGPEVADVAGAAFGVEIPLTPMRGNISDERAALWLGPDEWLLMAEDEPPAELAAALEAALASRPHSLVDVSQRQIGLEVFGAKAALAINAGCPLNLSPSAFGEGAATRTMLAKAEIVLWRRGPQSFQIEVWRSFADYAARFLIEAARRAPI